MYGYRDIKATSVKPGKHLLFIEFQPGREAEVKVVGKRTRKGQVDIRVERFGWLTGYKTDDRVAVK
jgi:hypothetical protein